MSESIFAVTENEIAMGDRESLNGLLAKLGLLKAVSIKSGNADPVVSFIKSGMPPIELSADAFRSLVEDRLRELRG